MTNISRAWTYICLCFCDMRFHIAPQTINKTTSKATSKPTNTPSEVVLDSAPHDDSTLIWSRTSCLTQRIPRSVVPSSHDSLQERSPESLIVQLMVGTLRGLNTSTSAPAQKSRDRWNQPIILNLPMLANPNFWHIYPASCSVHPLLQIAIQRLSLHISTFPSLSVAPPTNRMSLSVQLAAHNYDIY